MGRTGRAPGSGLAAGRRPADNPAKPGGDSRAVSVPGEAPPLSSFDSIAGGGEPPAGGARLARLYAPLAAAALLTALAGPAVNLALARGERPATALAGFWLGYSVLQLLEAACFVWQSTSLAFLGAPRARRRLAWLALATGAATSGLVWLAGTPAANAPETI